MFDYIWENKHWIFSGVGISIIGLFVLFIRHLLKKKSPITKRDIENISGNAAILGNHNIVHGSVILQQNTDKPETPSLFPFSDMSQEDIIRTMDELRVMPPLHLDDVTKNYIGMNVDLLTKYVSAYKKDDDLINVYLQLDTPWFVPIEIWCDVKLSEYKQFSILRRDANIRVIGKIAKFRRYNIDLTDVKIFFPK